MDNHDEKDEMLNKSDDSEAGSPNNDIPLWLQGIEEPEAEETKPIFSKDAQGNNWVREVETGDSEPANEDESDSVKNVEPTSTEYETEIDLSAFDDAHPDDHLEGDDGQSDTKAVESMDFPEGHDTPEEIEIQELPEHPYLDEIEPDFNQDSSVEGFLDISEMGFTEQPGEVDDFLDDEPLIERDLPEWLQEMIAESEQEADQVETDLGDEQDSKLMLQESTPDTLLPVEELLQEDETFPSSDIQEPDFDLEYAFSIAKEDTAPVELSTEDPKPEITDEEMPGVEEMHAIQEEDMIDEDFSPNADEEPVDRDSPDTEKEPAGQDVIMSEEADLITENITESTEEEQVYEESQSIEGIEQELAGEPLGIEDKDPFDRAKQFLDQGQITDALPIINDLIEDSENLAQLDVWLKEFAETETNKTSEVMETIGDIALKQNNPEAAFDAYAKALKFLLENKEVSDEID